MRSHNTCRGVHFAAKGNAQRTYLKAEISPLEPAFPNVGLSCITFGKSERPASRAGDYLEEREDKVRDREAQSPAREGACAPQGQGAWEQFVTIASDLKQ